MDATSSSRWDFRQATGHRYFAPEAEFVLYMCLAFSIEHRLVMLLY